jgi:N-acetylneuraminic acid mutarotase
VPLNYAVSDSKTVFFTIDTKTPTPTPVGSTDAWVAMAPLPVTGISGVAAISDRIYAVAGSNNVVYEYDPAANSWALKTHVPTSRDSFAVASCQGKLYVIGGAISRDPMNGDARSCGITEAYDPATDTWISAAPMPTARFNPSCAVVNDLLYVLGGGKA